MLTAWISPAIDARGFQDGSWQNGASIVPADRLSVRDRVSRARSCPRRHHASSRGPWTRAWLDDSGLSCLGDAATQVVYSACSASAVYWSSMYAET
jgi:hypothetical protein